MPHTPNPKKTTIVIIGVAIAIVVIAAVAIIINESEQNDSKFDDWRELLDLPKTPNDTYSYEITLDDVETSMHLIYLHGELDYISVGGKALDANHISREFSRVLVYPEYVYSPFGTEEWSDGEQKIDACIVRGGNVPGIDYVVYGENGYLLYGDVTVENKHIIFQLSGWYEGEPKTKMHIVYLNNGESNYHTFEIEDGSHIDEALLPMRQPQNSDVMTTAYYFDGWYVSSGEEWDFEHDVVSSDLVLHASWIPILYLSYGHNNDVAIIFSHYDTYGTVLWGDGTSSEVQSGRDSAFHTYAINSGTIVATMFSGGEWRTVSIDFDFDRYWATHS